VKQLYSPVRWSETISLLASDGIDKVVEVGPGKVLQGLNKRINKSLHSVSLNTSDTLQQAKDLVASDV
jgi:[acyl-carrier-protein] S-malonyltransferase